MEGRIHRDFAQFMQAHYITIGEKYTGTTWTAGLIQRIWTLLYRPIWDIRNACVHKKENHSNTTRAREDLQNRVREKYRGTTQTSLLTRDKHLLTTPLNELLQQLNTVLRAWLDTHQVAIADIQKMLTSDQRASAYTLKSWMIPRTQE